MTWKKTVPYGKLKIFLKDKETVSTGKINLRAKKKDFPNSVFFLKKKVGERVLGECTTRMKNDLETRSFCYTIHKQQTKAR